MRVVIFAQSIAADCNHGNAHFLRGVVRELFARGVDVVVHEARTPWSGTLRASGDADAALDDWLLAYPRLATARQIYDPASLDLDQALDGADLVLVHEWNTHALVHRVGEHRARTGGAARGGYALLFHDTHHRAVTHPASMASRDLGRYDGVLAYGDAIRRVYERERWASQVWTWHEAADAPLFAPLPAVNRVRDLAWLGSWGDERHAADLREFLVEPVRTLRLRAMAHGERFPDGTVSELRAAGIEYGGWLPNHRVPALYAAHQVTVHVPRRQHAQLLPGIPSSRMFEALACGIPLVSAPWNDSEELFTPGADFLVARDGAAMVTQLRMLLSDPEAASALAAHGRHTVLARHTCAHRVDELLSIAARLGVQPAPAQFSLTR